MATVRIYVRASTKDQNAERALADLIKFSKSYSKRILPTLKTIAVLNLIDHSSLNYLMTLNKAISC